MNRRKFIKSFVILLGLSLTDPRQFLKHITGLRKLRKNQSLSWTDEMLRLHPTNKPPYLFEVLKNSKPPEIHPWWKDTLK